MHSQKMFGGSHFQLFKLFFMTTLSLSLSNKNIPAVDVSTSTSTSRSSCSFFAAKNGNSINCKQSIGDIETIITTDETVYETYGSLWTVADLWGFAKTNPAFDEEIVDDGMGNMVWRVSNAATSSKLNYQPFTPSSTLAAGESSAGLLNDWGVSDPASASPRPKMRAVAETPYFHSYLKFKSASTLAQPGLAVKLCAAPKQGDIRQSSLSIQDNGVNGFDVSFNEIDASGSIVSVPIVYNLTYIDWHELEIYITFVDGLNSDGSANDEVSIFIDGKHVHSGTSWETYYRHHEGSYPQNTYAVDSLMFELSGNAAADTKGMGFYFDNVTVDNKAIPSDEPTSSPNSFETLMLHFTKSAVSNTQRARGLQATSPPTSSAIPSSFPTISVIPTLFPTTSVSPSEGPTRKPTRKPTRRPTRKPTNKPTPLPSPSPSSKPSSKPSPKPSPVPSGSPIKAPTIIIGQQDNCGCCDETCCDALAEEYAAQINDETTTVTKIGCNLNCDSEECGASTSSGLSRAVRPQSVTIFYELEQLASTDPEDILEPEEFTELLNSKAQVVSEVVSTRLGIDIVVQDNARVIEAPSSKPSLSPAPSISQLPSLSLKPTLKNQPSASPTISQEPSSSPTKRSSNTFQITSSFKFDDSLRDFCLNAMNFRVGKRVKMRPCLNDFRKQLWFLDDFDQLRLRRRPEFCLIYKRRDIQLGKCKNDGTTNNSKFFYDKLRGEIYVQKQKRKLYVGLEPTAKYGPVKLFLENQNDSLNKWSLI